MRRPRIGQASAYSFAPPLHPRPQRRHDMVTRPGPGMQTPGVPAESGGPLVAFHATSLTDSRGRNVLQHGAQPRPGSLFAAVDNKSRWLFAVPYDLDTEPAESLTEDRCLELVRGGLGDDSVELRYIGHRIW